MLYAKKIYTNFKERIIYLYKRGGNYFIDEQDYFIERRRDIFCIELGGVKFLWILVWKSLLTKISIYFYNVFKISSESLYHTCMSGLYIIEIVVSIKKISSYFFFKYLIYMQFICKEKSTDCFIGSSLDTLIPDIHQW